MKSNESKVLDSDEDRRNMFKLFEDEAQTRSKFKPDPVRYTEYPNPEDGKKQLKEEIKSELLVELNIKSKVYQEINSLLKTEGFLDSTRDYFSKHINDEIRVQVKNYDTHKAVNDLVADKVKSNFQPLANMVIERAITRLAEKMTNEVNIIRDMSHSLSSEIRHLSMKMPVSPSYEKDITKHIMEKIDKLTFKQANKLLEDKNE